MMKVQQRVVEKRSRQLRTTIRQHENGKSGVSGADGQSPRGRCGKREERLKINAASAIKCIKHFNGGRQSAGARVGKRAKARLT